MDSALLDRAGKVAQPYKRRVQAALRRVGLAIGRYPYYGTRSAQLAHVLNVNQITVCLDVGAHHGEFGSELRSIGYSGRIVSFEPASAAYAVLARQTRRDPRWQARQLALGSSARIDELNLCRSTVFNSIHPLTDAGLDRTTPIGVEPVAVERLDKMWHQIVRSDDRIFLKIDTQGSDIEVLTGSDEMISQVAMLQMEAAVNEPLYDGAANLATVIDAARSHGFQLSGIFPVAADKCGTRLVEVDCLFVRGDAAPAGGAQ